ncbi:9466_t:CDS:2 [Funneliformis mosseae]|uniref:9466_t:CDS:1 n=1 Tax=Funneliformis mosseae TaxID=27381 RepID=A0A9N9H653_FUNMO|nr:9466_t:CDS:2 [Funneliformis mosseae]
MEDSNLQIIDLDPDHYQDFNSLYGHNTTKKDHHECKELALNGILVASRVHDLFFDFESLQMAMEIFVYTCGSPIVPEDHPLYNKIFVRMNLTCNSPIEQGKIQMRKI